MPTTLDVPPIPKCRVTERPRSKVVMVVLAADEHCIFILNMDFSSNIQVKN